MGGKASCAAFGGRAVHRIIQSSTTVLKYSVVPRHAISSGVAVSVDDTYRESLGKPPARFRPIQTAGTGCPDMVCNGRSRWSE
jgi:hypothetical protein